MDVSGVVHYPSAPARPLGPTCMRRRFATSFRWLAARPALGVGVAAALFWGAALLGIGMLRFGGDLRGHLCLGNQTKLPPSLGTAPRNSLWGYDGQYFAILATDPLLRQPDTAPSLDNPPYRAGRIGLPLLAWALAMGRPGLAVALYQWLCWLPAALGLVVVARWLQQEGASGWEALVLVPTAGLAASLLRCTPDAAAVALVVTALWLWREDRFSLCVVALAAAALVRETSLIAALAVCLAELRARRWWRAAAVGSPGAVLGLWKLAVFLRLGAGDTLGSANFDLPLRWVGPKLALLHRASARLIEGPGLLLALLMIVALILLAATPRRWSPAELTFAGFAILGLALGHEVWGESWAYSRVLLALPMLALPLAARQGHGWGAGLLTAVALVPSLAGLGMVLREGNEAWDLATAARQLGRAWAGQLQRLQPCYVLPVAHASGRDGSLWRTELLLHSWIPGPLPLKIELLKPGRAGTPPPAVTLHLAAHEPRRIEDAVWELFSFHGSGALRVTPCRNVLDVHSRTVDVTRTTERGDWNPAQLEDHAVTGRHPGRLELGATTTPGTRVNLGVLALDHEPASVQVWMGQVGKRALLRTVDVGAGELGSLLDVVPRRTDGAIRLALEVAPETGRVLAYATVVYGNGRPPLVVVPQTRE